MDGYTLRYVGDQALSVEFEEEISLPVNRKVTALYQALAACRIPGVGELVPTYRALLIHYDALRTDLKALTAAVERCAAHLVLTKLPKALVTEIPVLF